MKEFMSSFEDYFIFNLDKVIRDKNIGYVVDTNARITTLRPNLKRINKTTTQAFICTYLVYLKDSVDTIRVWMEYNTATKVERLIFHLSTQAFDDSRLNSTKHLRENYQDLGYLWLWTLLTEYRYEALRNIELIDRAANLTPKSFF